MTDPREGAIIWEKSSFTWSMIAEMLSRERNYRRSPENQARMMPLPRLALSFTLLTMTILLAGCMAPGMNGPPPANETYSPSELRYILLDSHNESLFFFCDPDYYPVSRDDEQERALAAFPVIRDNKEEFGVIIARKGLEPPFTNESVLTIYREHKKLDAIPLVPAGSMRYAFSLQLKDREEGRRVSGIIRTDGVILEEHSGPVFLTCPICLASGTLIDSPNGPVPVEVVKAGMIVWTEDTDGSRSGVTVLRTSRTRVPEGHWFVRLRLSDGREITASPGHPTADKRAVGSLMTGDKLDGAVVTGVETRLSDEEFTYDILPSGETGTYWADGILLASTLR